MQIQLHRVLLAAACAVLIAAIAPRAAHAQAFPSQPITLIVPWPAGGGSDTAMRLTADAATTLAAVAASKPSGSSASPNTTTAVVTNASGRHRTGTSSPLTGEDGGAGDPDDKLSTTSSVPNASSATAIARGT